MSIGFLEGLSSGLQSGIQLGIKARQSKTAAENAQASIMKQQNAKITAANKALNDAAELDRKKLKDYYDALDKANGLEEMNKIEKSYFNIQAKQYKKDLENKYYNEHEVPDRINFDTDKKYQAAIKDYEINKNKSIATDMKTFKPAQWSSIMVGGKRMIVSADEANTFNSITDEKARKKTYRLNADETGIIKTADDGSESIIQSEGWNNRFGQKEGNKSDYSIFREQYKIENPDATEEQTRRAFEKPHKPTVRTGLTSADLKSKMINYAVTSKKHIVRTEPDELGRTNIDWVKTKESFDENTRTTMEASISGSSEYKKRMETFEHSANSQKSLSELRDIIIDAKESGMFTKDISKTVWNKLKSSWDSASDDNQRTIVFEELMTQLGLEKTSAAGQMLKGALSDKDMSMMNDLFGTDLISSSNTVINKLSGMIAASRRKNTLEAESLYRKGATDRVLDYLANEQTEKVLRSKISAAKKEAKARGISRDILNRKINEIKKKHYQADNSVSEKNKDRVNKDIAPNMKAKKEKKETGTYQGRKIGTIIKYSNGDRYEVTSRGYKKIN